MIIHFNTTDQVEVTCTDTAYRYRAVMGENSLTLTFALPQFIEIPVGAYCDFEGERYTLTTPPVIKKNSTRNFEYNAVFESAQFHLAKYKFRDLSTNKLKFSLTAKPHEHLQLLIDNLNLRDSGWTVGNYIYATEKGLSFNHTSCSEALTMIAEAFATEYEIVGKTIHLTKVEYNKTTPLAMSYGRGNGFKPGLGRTNYDSKKAIEILFVQGGERNINPSQYGSPELLLPISQTLTHEGRTYQSDSDGLSIRRSDKALATLEEGSIDLSNIYPSRTGTVSTVIAVDAEKNFYGFTDSTIPEALNYKDCQMAGETKITVIFQSGMLAGKEFDANYDHATRRFEIVSQTIDGQPMPNDEFKPIVGDTYAVFGISLPTAYVCDNTTKTGASWDLFREAAKYLHENEDPRFSFTGEVDGIWAKQNWTAIGAKIRLGGYISFTDTQFQAEAVLIRITGIKDFINNPYKPTIELSNVTAGKSVSSDLMQIAADQVKTNDLHQQAIAYAKRRFKDATGTTTAPMFKGDYDPAKIYTGTLQQVDIVKYDGLYYIANTEAGTFTNKPVTNPAYWLPFGSTYESIATNLLLAEFANIADWIIKDGKLTSQSTLSDNLTPRAQMDGANGGVSFNSEVETFDPSGNPQTTVQTIGISSETGTVQVISGNDIVRVSSQGIYINKAGENPNMPLITGSALRSAIVAIGKANLRKDALFTGSGLFPQICGVLGYAENTCIPAEDAAPSWGGIFYKLMVNGLYLGIRRINASTYLTGHDAYVSCYNTAPISVYLPPTPQQGQIIIIKKMNALAVTAYGNGKDIYTYVSIASCLVATDTGDAGVFIWDGNYWNYQLLTR